MLESFDTVLRHAEERFNKLPGGHPRERLALYENFLKLKHSRLLMHHRAAAGGRAIAQMRAQLMDVVLRHLYETIEADYKEKHPNEKLPPLALAAVGGYGRGELNPFSDIDLLFLHDSGRRVVQQPGFVKAVYDGILYLLWDIGLKVGYSARNLKECVAEANKDMESKTALIESRFLVGNKLLFDSTQKAVVSHCVRPCVEAYIESRMRDQTERHEKFGDTVFLQEPNVKNGCGGLRDFQNLLWMTFFKHGVRTLLELEERKFITPAERKTLEADYDFLLRVRNELHYVSGRSADVLTLAQQPQIATGLGYNEPDMLARIEHFMRDYYRHARHVFTLTNALAQRLALKPPGFFERSGIHVPMLHLGVKVEKQDGFVFRAGLIEAQSPEIFREDPLRMIRVFRYAQQQHASLSPELQTMLREHLRLVDNSFKSNPHVRETFLAILGDSGNVSRIMRLMHEVGFLGKYLPEFGALDALVQHEFYHRYTADEHTLVTLQRLDAVVTATEGVEAQYSRICREITRPDILYLAMLLHDIGKAANQPDHSETGAALTERIARRIGLDDDGRDTLLFLVRHHLAMSMTAQRRDLDDTDAIVEFARLVENVTRLNKLMLLTYADMTGTSAGIWNEWRNSLLWELYLKTRAELLAGAESQALQEQRLKEMMEHIRTSSALPADELEAHSREMQRRYFLTFTAQDIVEHLDLIHQFLERNADPDADALVPIVQWKDKPDRGYSQVVICTWDREGLFSKICGSFSFAGINILSAHGYSRYDGIVIDIFNVADVEGQVVNDNEQRSQFEKTLDRVLNRGDELDRLLARHRPARRSARAPQGVVPTKVTVDLKASRTRTVVDVQAEDRLGLLYTIAQTLARHGLDINLARISTEKGAAFDTFYVVDIGGNKVTDAGWLERVRIELERAIEELRRRPIEA